MTDDDRCATTTQLCYTLAPSMFFANRAVNRLAVHTALQQLAWCMSGAFFGVYLLRAGLAPSVLFLASAGVLTLRFVLRPLVLLVAPRIGLRYTLVIGTLLTALQYPAVGLVRGADATKTNESTGVGSRYRVSIAVGRLADGFRARGRQPQRHGAISRDAKWN